MSLKLNMSLIHDYTTNVAEPLIWNTLIPSRLELPNDIDDSGDKEEEDNDDNEDDDLSQ